MEFLSQYGIFLLQIVTVVFAILFTVAGIIALSSKDKGKSNLLITPLNEQYNKTVRAFSKELTDKKTQKQNKKIKKDYSKPRMFVIDFDGDIKASGVENLREEVTAILSVATPKDEVLIKISSPGGMVNTYGLASSQLQRIRDRGIPLVACVDKMAASGGYLMACVANKILAAPFAIIGSIGVVAQLPNFHRLLKKHNIDVELLTAGEHKRTLTVFGPNTDKGRKKFVEDLELIHESFKNAIINNRQQIDIEKVSTGEHWLAKDAFELRLVDKLITSDEYIIDSLTNFNVYIVKYKTKASIASKLLKPAASLLNPYY